MTLVWLRDILCVGHPTGILYPMADNFLSFRNLRVPSWHEGRQGLARTNFSGCLQGLYREWSWHLIREAVFLECFTSNKVEKMPTAHKNKLFCQSPLTVLTCLAALMFIIQGCATLKPYNPPPQTNQDQIQVPGFTGVRAWGDEPSETLKQSAIESLEQEKAANNGKLEPVVYALALSGGGQDGAFGAGVLCGWTQTGKRPQFKLVTGISTGSLIAPFAFLGPAYDHIIQKEYTSISDKDIYKAHKPLAILLSLVNIKPLPALTENKPMEKLVAGLVDDKLLAKIAEEHRKGRRLLIGTTQMDAQRLVIWNMGAIANSGNPKALELFRKIMVASASIPAFFPPQFFDVEAFGRTYKEMHVDGGVQAEVMLYENAIKPFTIGGQRDRKLYIIRNEQVYPQYKKVKYQLKDIASRAIDSLLKSQGVGDLYRLYTYAKRDDLDYNLAFIPKDFHATSTSEFDTAYMNALFQVGYNMAAKGYPWTKHPPDYSPNRE
jgi:predicted acylesterase/phospholipase RssA